MYPMLRTSTKSKHMFVLYRMYNYDLQCKSAADTDNLPSIAKLIRFFRGGYGLSASHNLSSPSRTQPQNIQLLKKLTITHIYYNCSKLYLSIYTYVFSTLKRDNHAHHY